MENIDMIATGKRIALFRKGKGLTQIQLAREVGILQREVSRIETGQARTPNPKYMAWLLNNGADLGYIFTGLKILKDHEPETSYTAPPQPGEVLQQWFDKLNRRMQTIEEDVRKLRADIVNHQR